MYDAWSMWSCVFKCPMHGKRQMQKKYPRKFQSETVTNVNEYPIYRRRDTGHIVLVHGIELDNRWVVPHNVYLLTKYDAQINVEVCNNIRAVKYLFKYVYKGHDRATVEISCQNDNAPEGNVVEVDEIKKYLDCCYVSTSEATWCIFKFDMHERFPTVERLQYHLPNQQMVLFNNTYYKITITNYISNTSLYMTFHMYPWGP